jgi:hypothetical protein
MVKRWPTTGPTTVSLIELSGSFAAQWLRDCLLQCCQTQSPIEIAAGREVSASPPFAAPRARCSNQLLEHLEHLRETNDLFGNLAKSQSEGK